MDGVVLSQVTVVPPHRGDAAAAVLLHRGVLWFARGWEPDDRGNSGRLILFFFCFSHWGGSESCAAPTRCHRVVGACNHVTVDGGGGDGHLVDLAAAQAVDGAGAGRGVAGGPVSVGADGPGGVVVRVQGLFPAHVHHVGVTV